ncbi:somatostatin receptor type 2 [Alosa sapidissima]|uniref:somatostatin receptor type 2 n=1 Tax=Alosa sapidissima TaxID=34773 RepID=UPI001C087F06|nr:somatostatin receptor type 2 [Alosa sapidissima]
MASVASAWSETSSLAWAVTVGDGVDGADDGVDLLSVLQGALYLLVCVCGLAGNVLVAVAVVMRDRLASATSVYVLTLALADGLFMLGLPLLATQTLLGRWPFGEAACRLTMALDGMNQFTSAFLLAAMGLDRYAALTAPLRWWAWRSPRRAGLVASALWLLSLTPVLPVATRFSARSGYCALDAELMEGAGGLLFLTSAFLLGFALPLGVMVSTCGALAWRRQAGAVVTETERAERQVGVMVAAVAGVFGVCWLPFYLLNFLSLCLDAALLDEGFVRAFEAAVLLSYAWSCANPALYALLCPTLRRHFSTLLCPHKHPPTSHTHTRTHTHTERYHLNDTALPDPGEVV